MQSPYESTESTKAQPVHCPKKEFEANCRGLLLSDVHFHTIKTAPSNDWNKQIVVF